jgi:hypothetical protein
VEVLLPESRESSSSFNNHPTLEIGHHAKDNSAAAVLEGAAALVKAVKGDQRASRVTNTKKMLEQVKSVSSRFQRERARRAKSMGAEIRSRSL